MYTRHCACRQIDMLLRLQGVAAAPRRVAVGAWLFNPFTATISSRGSGEALVVVMLLHMLLCLFRGASGLVSVLVTVKLGSGQKAGRGPECTSALPLLLSFESIIMLLHMLLCRVRAA